MADILLFRGSPRSNIKEVENYNPLLPCDKLIIRFKTEFFAYEEARNFFLNEGDWEYLVLATDDIVVKPEHIIQLQKDIDNFHYPVISGIMNVDQNEYQLPYGNLNICHELALKDRRLRQYNWIKRRDLPEEDIFPVKFSGFPLMAIRRDVVKMTPFAADGVYKGKPMNLGASLDFVFCWFCHEKGIPIYADKRINMQHLRISGRMQIGEREPITEFLPFNNTSQITSCHTAQTLRPK